MNSCEWGTENYFRLLSEALQISINVCKRNVTQPLKFGEEHSKVCHLCVEYSPFGCEHYCACVNENVANAEEISRNCKGKIENKNHAKPAFS